jgi:aspartate/methionine/tyrosine aminotransferase
VALIEPYERDAVAPFALERWFAEQAPRARIDLAASGAPPLRLAELLALATPNERAAFEAASLGYGPPGGTEALRDAIAARADGLGSRDVVVTCGAIEALHLAVAALVGPGDDVVVQQPMYGAVAGLARARGARVVAWRLRPDASFRADVGDLRSLLTQRTRLVAITQPNAPTGSVLEEDALASLVDLLAPRGIWLLSDEVYRDLVLDGPMPAHAAARYERALSVGDVAKPFGLGGLRIGWVLTQDADLVNDLATWRDYTTLSIPTVSDLLARLALAHGEPFVARARRNALANLAALAALAARLRSPRREPLSFVRPRAGATAYVRVPEAGRVQQRLADRGVAVVPGELFGDRDRLRIGLAGPRSAFAVGLAALEAALA